MKSMSVFISVLLMGSIAWSSNIDKQLEAQIRAINSGETIEEQIDQSPLEEKEKEYFLEHFKKLEIKKLPSSKLLKRKLDIQSRGPRPVHTIEFKSPSVGKIILNGYELKGMHKMGPKKRIAYIRRVLRKTSKEKTAMLNLMPKAYAADESWLDMEAPVVGLFSYFGSTSFQDAISDTNKRFKGKQPHRVRLTCNKIGSRKTDLTSTLTIMTKNQNGQVIEHNLNLGRDLTSKEKTEISVNVTRQNYFGIKTAPVTDYRASQYTKVTLKDRDSILKVSGTYNSDKNVTLLSNPQKKSKTNSLCEQKKNRPEQSCSKKFDPAFVPGPVLSAQREFDSAAFYPLIQTCCESSQAESCSKEISQDPKFGLDAPGIEGALKRRKSGNQ